MMNDEASDLMKRGIAAMDTGSPESLAEAVGCFDAATDLRRRLFTTDNHEAAYLLAASWMNRGDALARLGGAERLAEALRSYNETLTALRDAPPALDPLYRRCHAVAWMHRGLTLQEQATAPALEEAVRSFEQAMEATQGHPEHDLLLASVAINHARTLLTIQPPRAAAARRSALLALERVRETETHAPLAAEIHLKAQIFLCRTAEALLSDAPEPAQAREWVSEATDAVETGLLLARRWEERGETCLGRLPTILFHFGLDLYRRRQPQFLAEFVRESLQTSVSVEWHRLAAETLVAEIRTLPPGGFTFLNTPQPSLKENIETLHFVEARLRELRPLGV